MTHYSQLYFRVHMHTAFSERVVLVGSSPSLGCWNPHKGQDLSTSPNEYPHWSTPQALRFPKGSSFDFKFLVMRNDQVVRWEGLDNRRYSVKHDKALLRCYEGEYKGQEVVQRRGKKRRSRLFSQEKARKTRFNGYLQADETSSSESDLSLSSSKSAPFGDISAQRSLLYDSFNNQNLAETPKEKLFIREINFFSTKNAKNSSEKPFIASLSGKPGKNTVISKRLRTLKMLKMLNNSNSSSSSSFKEDPGLKKPRKCVKLSDLYDTSRRKSPEKLKMSLSKGPQHQDPASKHEDPAQSIAYDEHILILTLYLPLTVQRVDKDFEVRFRYEKPLFELESFLITRLMSHYKRMLWIGLLKEPLEHPEDQKKVAEMLLEKYKCRVLFENQSKNDWACYYKKLWRPMMRNTLDLQSISSPEALRLSVDRFKGWYAGEVSPLIEESTLVLVLDSFLSFLCEGLYSRGAKVALYSRFPFPGEETRLMNACGDEDLLRSFMNTHLLAFNGYKPMKRLFEAAENDRRYNMKPESERGSLYLCGKTRKIALKTVYPAVDLHHIEQFLKKSSDFIVFSTAFRKELSGQKVLLCLETLEDSKGTALRLLYLKRFLIETSNKYRLKVILLLECQKQPGAPLQDELLNLRETVNKINNTVFTNPFDSESPLDFSTIRLFEGPFPKPMVAALMSLADLLLAHSLGDEGLLQALEFLALSEQNGVCLCSETCEQMQGFSGFVAYNAYKYESFKEKLKQVLQMDAEVLREISNNDKAIIRKTSVLNWFESIVFELKRSLRKPTADQEDMPSDSLLLRQIGRNEEALELLEHYKTSKNRLFFFQKISQKPFRGDKFPNEVLKTLEILANDPRNSLFLISEESLEVLDLAAKKIRNLGLLSENGFFYRTDGKQRWRQLFPMDFRWKERVLGIMKRFASHTEKAKVLNRDSFAVWDFAGCDQELGRKQADELESVLRNELRQEINKVEVVRGQAGVVVRPLGVNKANMVELVIQKVVLEKGRVDFMLNFEERSLDEVGESAMDGITRLIRENPSLFETYLKSFSWPKSPENPVLDDDDSDFLRLLHRFLALYL